MKFLIFNGVVAVALIYLFTADREELRATADRVYDGARTIQNTAESLAEEHDLAFANKESPVTGETPDPTAKDVEAPGPAVTESEAPNAPPAQQGAAPSVTAEAPRDTQASPTAEDFFETVVAEEKVATLEPLSEQSVDPLPVHPVPDQPPLDGQPAPVKQPVLGTQPVLDGLPPVSDPAVERRRAEVLKGIDGPATSPGVVIPEGTELMSPDERLRALYDLAEEMELLAVTKIHR